MYIELAVKYWKYHKKSAVFIILSICLSVAAMVSAALLVRSNKIQQLEQNLVACGNCDFEFYNISENAEERLRTDKHFAEFGSVYRCGYAKGECGVTFEMGYIEDKTTEDMFHLTPIEGRYPENSGEICIDKVTLNSLGYAAKVGQKLELTCMDYNQSELKTESFMVVGIIEQRITMSDLGTEYIQRQFSGVVNNEMVTVNAPYAYVYGKEANTIYKNGIQKILLANVAVTDNFDDQDMKNILCDEFIRDGVWTGEFLFNPNKVNNRSWMANVLLGFKSMVSNDSWGYHAAEERIGTDTTQKDFYSAVLIPVFFVLIILITFISLYNAINMTLSVRIRQNGMLRSLGMSIRSCQMHLALETGLLLVPGILGGYGLGCLIYVFVQRIQQCVFGIHVMGAWDVSDYFRVYLEEATFSPLVLPMVAICIALIPAVVLPAIQNGKVSPVAAYSIRNHIHKKQQRFLILVYVNILVVMIAAVFGYSYFCSDNYNKNEIYHTQLESTKLSGWDYFMDRDTNYTVKGYGSEIRHDTGISQNDLDTIRTCGAVEKSEAMIINLSTKITVESSENNRLTMDTLEMADILTMPIWVETEEEKELYDLRNQREMEYRGYDNNTMIYQVPSIGLEDCAWDTLEKYVVEGRIDLDKIKAGKEVVLVVQDIQECSYHAGDKFPLNDDVYPEMVDISADYQCDIFPDFWEPTYEAEGDNWPQYCFAKRTRLDTTIGAVVVISNEQDKQKYFIDFDGVFPWNVFVSTETFENWNLPDKRYGRLWVKCKEGADIELFERIWYQAVTDGQIMKSYIAKDIREKIDKTNCGGMSLFFTLILMILLVTLVGTVNSFSMGIYMERKRLNMLRAIGATKQWLMRRWCIKNLLLIMVGGILSVVPVYVFDQIAGKATRLIEEAFQNGVPLQMEHWAHRIAGYFLMKYHPHIVAVVVTVITILLTTVLIGVCMKRELNHSIVDGIRESD